MQRRMAAGPRPTHHKAKQPYPTTYERRFRKTKERTRFSRPSVQLTGMRSCTASMMQRLRGPAQRELRSSLRCWRAAKPSTDERGKWRGRVENQPQVKRPSLLQHEILADVAYGPIATFCTAAKKCFYLITSSAVANSETGKLLPGRITGSDPERTKAK